MAGVWTVRCPFCPAGVTVAVSPKTPEAPKFIRCATCNAKLLLRTGVYNEYKRPRVREERINLLAIG